MSNGGPVSVSRCVMSRHVRARMACATLIFFYAIPAHAGPLTIDLPGALARARERAPEAIGARARVGEAQATRVGARVRFTQNPELDVGAGPRLGDPRTTQVEARISQQLEPGRRGDRIRVADAGIRHAEAANDARLRELSFEVASVFIEARHADLVVELARRD